MHRERIVAAMDELVERCGGPQSAAKTVGVRRDTFNQWRSRKAVPGPHLAALSRASRLSGDYLLGLSDTPRPEPIVREVQVIEPPDDWEDFRRRPCIGVVGAR